jgi:tRNA pseudouridine(55) synthase
MFLGNSLKHFVGFVLSVVLVAAVSTPASAEDAFNADLTSTADGRATFLVGEDNVGVRFSTMLAGKNNIRNIRWSCESVTDPECSRSKADFIASSSLLKVCTSGADQNCVVRLELAGEDGIFQPATFLRNTNGLNFAAHAGTGFMGATTPSYDLETEIDETFPINHIDETLIQNILPQFIGEIDQKPPVFSAIKKDGIRMYEHARAGTEMEMKSRKTTIHEFEITRIDIPEIDFRVVCSKGTYIRSLAHDFGKALNSGAHLTALRRTKIGNFSVENAVSPDDFESNLMKK